MSRFFARALAGFLLGLAACKEEALPPPPPVPVTLAAVERQAVPFELLATGTVEPLQAVSVQPQVSGPIVRVAFREGQDVEKGQVLFQIDPRPFQAALSRAEAILERDKAQEANARQEAARYSELAGQEYVTAQQYDQSRTAAAAAAATLAASRGGARGGAAQSPVRHHPRADRGPHRKPAGARGQPGAGQRGDASGHHQPDPPHPGAIRRARRQPAR